MDGRREGWTDKWMYGWTEGLLWASGPGRAERISTQPQGERGVYGNEPRPAESCVQSTRAGPPSGPGRGPQGVGMGLMGRWDGGMERGFIGRCMA